MMIIGLLGIFIGMIIENILTNINLQQSEEDPQLETIQVIEINDNRQQEKQQDYFKPF